MISAPPRCDPRSTRRENAPLHALPRLHAKNPLAFAERLAPRWCHSLGGPKPTLSNVHSGDAWQSLPASELSGPDGVEAPRGCPPTKLQNGGASLRGSTSPG